MSYFPLIFAVFLHNSFVRYFVIHLIITNIVHGKIKGVKERVKQQSHLFPNSIGPHEISREWKISHLNKLWNEYCHPLLERMQMETIIPENNFTISIKSL